MAQPPRHKPRGVKRPPVKVYASSSDSEDYSGSSTTAHARKSKAKKASSKKRRSNWSDDDFSPDKDDDDELYLHIQNGQGISDAVAIAPSPRRKKHKSDQPRGLRHSHLWRSEFPPWLRKVDSNTIVCPNEELEHMATYLSVKPQEIQARRDIVGVISDTIRATFSNSHELEFHLFGSLATATSSLATFRSDIDLTIEVVPPPPSDAVVYSSVMYDDDDEFDTGRSFFDETDADFDVTGMQFNFVTHEAPAASSHAHIQVAASAPQPVGNAANVKPAMTRAERNQCVRFLHKAAKALRQAHPSFVIEVRRLAKVPIINVIDRTSNIEVDVSLGMETPSPGDQIVAWYAANHPEFNILVVLLKEFLYQNAINKPFEGGIGSFRLYCMVTHILASSPKQRGAAPLLLRFFEHFGCAHKFNNRTVLKLRLPQHDPPLKCEVEFQSIFRIRDCTHLFQEAFERLQHVVQLHHSSKRRQVVPNDQDDDAGVTSGVLASLFWTHDLREEREHRLALAVQRSGTAGAAPTVATLLADDKDIRAGTTKQPKKKQTPVIVDKNFGKKRVTTSAKKLKRQQARRARIATGQ